VPQDETRLSWRSVRGYVTALTDLYRTQKGIGINSHQSPREDNVRDYLKVLQRRDAQREKEQFADKGRDTLLDGYTEDEFESVCRELWARGDSSPECYLRTLVDILLGHYMLTRGGDRRSAEISDLFTFEFKGEGPTRCIPLIFTTRAGKQNQHGRLETIGALRNKKPLVCMLSGLAFYLLYRWDLSDELFPDFSKRSAWYNIRLIKSSAGDRETAFSYNSQREWVAKAFQSVGVFSQKKTHIGRSAGAKTAELKGVSEDQIRRAGRWNQEQMVGCYLNSLPREFMRTMAGHSPQMGCFEIRRASVAPPDVLLSTIWPELDVWKGRFGPQVGQVNDLAATGATNLLFYLREVILQDSVVLREMFPSSPVWNHPVFQHEAYLPFARKVEACLRQEEEGPSQLSILYQAVPAIADHLKTMDARARELQASFDRMAESQWAQSSQLQLLTSGSLTFRLEVPSASVCSRPTAHLPTARPPAPLSVAESSQDTSARASAVASPSPAPPQLQLQLQPQQGPEPEQPPEQPPAYRMCRAVKSVRALWREWTEGLRGNPSVAALDSKWGSRWRAGRQNELQWYSLRLEVIKEIKRVAQAQRVSEEAAMWQVNQQQERMQCSLDQLCKRLRAGRKASK
jgi:Centromere DNA-binding protein complex CBF3 subunit, domain 2/Transcriptional activator of glycolytic enzymes